MTIKISLIIYQKKVYPLVHGWVHFLSILWKCRLQHCRYIEGWLCKSSICFFIQWHLEPFHIHPSMWPSLINVQKQYGRFYHFCPCVCCIFFPSVFALYALECFTNTGGTDFFGCRLHYVIVQPIKELLGKWTEKRWVFVLYYLFIVSMCIVLRHDIFVGQKLAIQK